MKKSIIYIALIVATFSIAFYVIKLNDERKSGNGFNRKLKTVSLKVKNVILLPDRLFGFAGEYNGTIMLRTYAKPLHLFKLDSSFTKIDSIKIIYPENFNTKTANIYKDCQGSDIYISNINGDVSDLNENHPILYKSKRLNFDNIKIISNKNIVARSYSNIGEQRNFVISKLFLSKNINETKQYMLPAHKNATFANDGWLHIDKNYGRILYAYYYRGEFICLDTNLKLKYKAKTIDTVRALSIRTAVITSPNKNGGLIKRVTQAAPPKIVMRYITTYKDKIFILSRLKSANESEESFKNNQPIDVYSITNGEYLYSFHIPKYRHFKLTHFKISGNKLIGIFGTYLVVYRFT